jgi:hypothetical protein
MENIYPNNKQASQNMPKLLTLIPLALAIYGSHHFKAKFLMKSLSMKN